MAADVDLSAYPQLLSVVQLAEILGISDDTIYDQLTEDTFPIPLCEGIGRRKKFARVQVERYLAGEPVSTSIERAS
jgi:predicted DNA-binding transcriptional regulator AlpA